MEQVFERISQGGLPLHSVGGLLTLFVALLIGWGALTIFNEHRSNRFEYKKKKADGETVKYKDTPDNGWYLFAGFLFFLHLLMSYLGWSAMVGHWV